MMKRIQNILRYKLLVLLALGCLPCQKTAAMGSYAKETWLAANYVRDVVGRVGQCIAGYTLYETCKKVGVGGMLTMLTSKPLAPIAFLYLASSVVNYWSYRHLFSVGWWEECSPDYDHLLNVKHMCKAEGYAPATMPRIFTARVVTGWLWFASVLSFLKVAQPLSVSASASRMFA